MNTINETYINALLADASYVNLHDYAGINSDPLKTGTELNAAIAMRMTQPQADFITRRQTWGQDKHGVRSCLLPF
jgi:hypothetical protein